MFDSSWRQSLLRLSTLVFQLTSMMTYMTINLYYCRMLRSSTAHLLQRPLVLTSVASRAFTVTAPIVCNSLSVNTRSADSFESFKRRLKSELFASTYANYDGSAPSQHSDSCFTRLIALCKSISSSTVAVIIMIKAF